MHSRRRVDKQINDGTVAGRSDMPNNHLKRRGAIGVIVRESRLLVIERSASVPAPGKFCFPGGSIESGETDEQAVVRELREEINVEVRPHRLIWTSETPRLQLMWWRVELDQEQQPIANPAEVAGVFWMSVEELEAHDELLHTNRIFLKQLRLGAICL